MIYSKPPLEEVMLEHFGVKGMHWGVRKSLTPAQERQRQLERVNKKINRIDANRVIEGASLQGWQLKKMAKKELKKNPNFTFSKLTPAQREAHLQRASDRARRRVIARGVVETGIILGGGLLALSQVKASPQTIRGAQASVGILSAKGGLSVVSNVNSIRANDRLRKLQAERDRLQKKTG